MNPACDCASPVAKALGQEGTETPLQFPASVPNVGSVPAAFYEYVHQRAASA